LPGSDAGRRAQTAGRYPRENTTATDCSRHPWPDEPLSVWPYRKLMLAPSGRVASNKAGGERASLPPHTSGPKNVDLV